MNTSNRHIWRGVVVLLVGLSLTGCDPFKRENRTPPDSGGGVVGKQQDQFGAGFAAAFNADSNSEPVAVKEGDIIPVSLTSEPVPIN